MSAKRICILTAVHPLYDARIHCREAATVLRAGYGVSLVAQHVGDYVVRGIHVIGLPRPRNRVDRMVQLPRGVLRVALKERADAFHVHEPELLPVALLLRAFGRRVVYDAHEDLPQKIRAKVRTPELARPLLAWLARFFLCATSRLLTGVIAATEGVAQGFRSRVDIARNCSDVPFSAHRIGSEGDKTSLIYVGGTSFAGVREMVKATERNDRVLLRLIGQERRNEGVM